MILLQGHKLLGNFYNGYTAMHNKELNLTDVIISLCTPPIITRLPPSVSYCWSMYTRGNFVLVVVEIGNLQQVLVKGEHVYLLEIFCVDSNNIYTKYTKKMAMVMQEEAPSPNFKQDSLTQAFNNKKKVLSFLLFLLLLFFILLPLFSPLSGVNTLKFGHMPSYYGCDMANHTLPLGVCSFTPPHIYCLPSKEPPQTTPPSKKRSASAPPPNPTSTSSLPPTSYSNLRTSKEEPRKKKRK